MLKSASTDKKPVSVNCEIAILAVAVASDGLTQFFRVGSLVQDVVGDLEGKADLLAEFAHGGYLRVRSHTQDGSDLTGGCHKGAGLAGVDEAELFVGDRLSLRKDVGDLSPDQAIPTGCLG